MPTHTANTNTSEHETTIEQSDTLKRCVELGMYCQKAITAAVYKFTGDYFISQKTSGERVEVIFQKKPGADADFSLLSNLFENELIDQQVRLEVEEKFGAIRNLIVQKAFSPIN